jgi:hypothetical protein
MTTSRKRNRKTPKNKGVVSIPKLLAVFAIVAVGCGLVYLAGTVGKQLAEGKFSLSRERFTIGRDTTWITEPVLPDGQVDYIAYFNGRGSQNVRSEENLVTAIAKMTGSGFTTPASHAEFVRLLQADIPTDIRGSKLLEFSESRRGVPDQLLRRAWTRDQNLEISQLIDGTERELNEFCDAIRVRTKWYSPFVYEMDQQLPDLPRLMSVTVPQAERIRKLADLLAARSMLRLGEGRIDDAISDAMDLMRLGRAPLHSELSIERLVGWSICSQASSLIVELINNRNIQAEQLEELTLFVDQLPTIASFFDQTLESDRCMGLDAVCQLRLRGSNVLTQMSAIARLESTVPVTTSQRIPNFDWDTALREINLYYDRLEKDVVSQGPYQSRKVAWDRVSQDIPLTQSSVRGTNKPVEMGRLFLAMTSSHEALLKKDATIQAQQQLLKYAIAIRTLALAKQPAPRSLRDVDGSLTPIDPFSDQDFKMFWEGNSAVRVYSVGENGRDENGSIDNTNDLGYRVVYQNVLPPVTPLNSPAKVIGPPPPIRVPASKAPNQRNPGF